MNYKIANLDNVTLNDLYTFEKEGTIKVKDAGLDEELAKSIDVKKIK